MISSVVAPSSSMPLNIRNLKVSLSPQKKHHVLFFSPVLNRLVVPFSVQTSLFDSNGFSSNLAESAGSVCNTRTKPLNQGVNDQNDICTKVWNPILNDQKETLTGQL